MGRWPRRLFTLAAAASAVLFVGVCGLWVRSFFHPAAYRFPYRGESCEVVLIRGRVGASNAPEVVGRAIMRRAGRPGGQRAAMTALPGPRYWSRSSPVIAPVLILLLLVLPAVAIREWRGRLSRRRAGLCPACGYDLRATPGRCPECGAVSGQVKGPA